MHTLLRSGILLVALLLAALSSLPAPCWAKSDIISTAGLEAYPEIEYCLKKTDTTLREVRDTAANDFEGISANARCYIKCIYEETGLITKYGYSERRFVQLMWKMPSHIAQMCFGQCQALLVNLKKATQEGQLSECDVAFMFFLCVNYMNRMFTLLM